ncbi:hypothetical protein PSGE105469_17555 [Pseudomonas gessardii]
MPFPRKAPRWWCALPTACRTSPISKLPAPRTEHALRAEGDQVWQQSEACQQRVDADGNWLRQTDGKIRDIVIEREVEAMGNKETFQNHTRTVDDHSTESVGGIKTLEALGALKLLSGGSASLAAMDDLHQATGRDLNLVVGQKHNATVGGDMQERIEGLRQSVAGGQSADRGSQDMVGIRGG